MHERNAEMRDGVAMMIVTLITLTVSGDRPHSGRVIERKRTRIASS